MYTKSFEVSLVYASLALASLFSSAGRLRWLLAAMAVIGGYLALQWQSAHFLVLAHLHNLMPALFLLLHPAQNKWSMWTSLLLWAAVIPALLLSGLLDGFLAFDAAFHAGPVDEVQGGRLRRAWATPWTSVETATRILASFSFLQWMHYFIWVLYLPRFGGMATPDQGGLVGRVLFGWIGLVAAVIATILLIPWYLSDYIASFYFYGALASFHALVEFPVLLFVLLESRANR